MTVECRKKQAVPANSRMQKPEQNSKQKTNDETHDCRSSQIGAGAMRAKPRPGKASARLRRCDYMRGDARREQARHGKGRRLGGGAARATQEGKAGGRDHYGHRSHARGPQPPRHGPRKEHTNGFQCVGNEPMKIR